MKRCVFASAFLLVLLLSACGQTVQPPFQSQPPDRSRSASSSEERKIAFTDALGQAFSMDRPQRAVVMIGSSGVGVDEDMIEPESLIPNW